MSARGFILLVSLSFTWAMSGAGGQTAPMPPAVPKAALRVITHYSSVTLAWDADTSSVAGYHLYYGGASGVYTNMLDAGNSTTVTIPRLIVGATYYFAVTAYDSIGLESDYSNELAFTIPQPVAKPVTILVTVTGTNLFSGPTIAGPWTRLTPTNATILTLTNPTSAQQFFRNAVKIKKTTL